MAARTKRCPHSDGRGFTKSVCAFCGREHFVTSLGHEAITLAQIAGIELDEWQKVDLVEMMSVDATGRWVYTTIGYCISRQNGKGEVLQARELYGLVTLADRILHTAHLVATATDAFERAEIVARGSAIDDYVTHYRYGNGSQQIECGDRVGLFYRARTAGGGRGIPMISLLVWDEAQELTVEQMAASSSTTLASEHQQKWLLGSGGMATSDAWHTMREDGLRAAGGGTGRIVGVTGRALWIEYTAETITIRDGVDGEEVIDIVQPDRHDRQNWALANPAYPHRVTPEDLEDELALFKTDPAKFDREHLGCWDARRRKGGARQTKLSPVAWAERVDEESAIESGLVLAVAVDWEQARSSVAAGGRRRDGTRHVELLEDRDGVEWLESFLRERLRRNRPLIVGYDGSGPARTVKPMLSRVCEEASADVKLVALSGPDYAAACEALCTSVADGSLWHLGDRVTPVAIKRATTRAVGKKWIWEWETADGVSPLAAMTVAGWCAESVPVRRSAYEDADTGLMVV